jgi:hypothetical protein
MTKIIKNNTKNIVTTFNRNSLVTLGMVAAISVFSNSSTALAVVNPANLAQPSYWYEDSDIRAVLKSRLDAGSSYVAPALPFASQELLTDIVRDSVNEARNVGTALIPVNFSNTHWAALAIKRTQNGTIKVIYNDSFGSPIGNKANGQLLADVLRQIDPTIQITDLQVHQQSDGSSCGAFTAENLITIAELDVSNLSDDELRSVLGRINDAAAVRNSHFYVLYEGAGVFDVTELKPRAETVAGELKSRNRQLLRNIINISSLTHDRLGHLSRADGFTGVSSGEGDLEHGVWVQGFVGSETDKDSVASGSAGSTRNHTTSKSNLSGFLLGVDTKLDEDTTVGVAFGHSQNTTKQKLQGILTNTDKISSNIFTLYGSGKIDDDISLNANIAFGKAIIKTTNQGAGISGNSTSKQKGDLLGGALIANYRLFASESIEISPRLGASYNQLTIKGHDDGSIKIAKNRQQELDINLGLAVTSFYDTSSFTLMPEISADYSHVVWNKGNKVKISNQLGQTILTQKINNNKGTVKLGTGITILADRIELGGRYEHSIQGKSRSHMGYAKLRVNF